MSGHAQYTITSTVEQAYQEYLDDVYPLDGWDGTPFSLLLKRGDPIAYQVGLDEFELELEPA